MKLGSRTFPPYGRLHVLIAASVLGLVLAGVMMHMIINGSGADQRASDGLGGSCPNATAALTHLNGDVIRDATLCLVNRERALRGQRALVVRSDLQTAAGAYARLMVRSGFFAHVSPAGSTLSGRVRRSGYLDDASGWSLGENLGWGTGKSRTPAGMVAAWMASPGHRTNLLTDDFRDVGVGVAIGSPALVCNDQAVTFTTDFGRRS